MTSKSHPRRLKAILSVTLSLAVASLGLLLPGISEAASPMPCDIYGAAGSPCVSADSTTRALYSSYNGPLYQVRRASDGATTDVGLLSPGGYANAATQDAFCANTSCVITKIYDQSPQHNDLTIEGPGPDGPQPPGTSDQSYNFSFGQDAGANATALPVKAGGHPVYGIYIPAKTGYRNDRTTGVATGSQPEGMYMVTSGTHVNGGCCFDYGNAETNMRDNGLSHMDSVNITYYCDTPPCAGSGPWVEDDMENGQYLGGNGSNPNNTGNNSSFVTAVVKNNGTTNMEIAGGNSQSGGLKIFWNGKLPNGYSPMHEEGAIVLGTGGGGDNNGIGSFFEGVVTSGYPTDAADAAVQANVESVGYSGATGGGAAPAGTITGPGGECVDVAGGDSGINLAPVDLWNCESTSLDNRWIHNSDLSLSTLGRCLDINGGVTANKTVVQLWDCNGGANQKWVQQANGSLLNPVSGRCLDSPGGATANGTKLEIYDCNGSPGQKFTVNGGGTVAAPGGRCLDVIGDDNGGNLAPADLFTCQPYAVDQHWYHNADNSLETLNRCLDITGGGTAVGTKVTLWDCSGGANQKWVQQSNGALLNPQSGLCLNSPSGATANGTQLEINTCNGTPGQKFTLS